MCAMEAYRLLLLALLFSSTCHCLAILTRAPTPQPAALYIVHLRSALPLAAYSGSVASFDGWADGSDAHANSTAPSGLQATAEAVAHEAAVLGGSIPRRARLAGDNPQIAAHGQMLESQQYQIAADVGVTSDNVVYSYKHATHGFAATLTPMQAQRLQRHPAVAAVQRSSLLKPLGSNHESTSPRTVDASTFLRMNRLWSAVGGQARAGEGMVIGVVDSGIWPEHPSFSGKGFPSSRPAGWSGKCEVTRDFPGCNNKVIGARMFYAGYKAEYNNTLPDLSEDWLSPRDGGGHGTWCAGAAAGNRDVAMAGGVASGMAPAARLAIYKVTWLYNDGVRISIADMLAGVNAAVADGVDVLSLSLGGKDASETYFDHMPFLNANLAGVFMAVAAGNDASYPDWGNQRTLHHFSPFYLTVGASTIGPGSLGQKPSGAAVAGSNATSASPPWTVPALYMKSSTGPLHDPSVDPMGAFPTNSILKPDIIGPGVDLLSAAPGTKVGAPGGYARDSGTSMATPHLAGIAALIMQRYPRWSPAQVMSAISTTAITTATSGAPITTQSGFPANPWEMGAGHVFPPNVLNPGLTYDARAPSYRNFLAGQDMKRARRVFPRGRLIAMAAHNLNRPSISVSRLRGSMTVFRTVMNVAASASTYTALVKPPPGVAVKVAPRRFRIAPGKSVIYKVTFKVTRPSLEFKFGSLTWVDGKGHAVRSPIVVQPIKK